MASSGRDRFVTPRNPRHIDSFKLDLVLNWSTAQEIVKLQFKRWEDEADVEIYSEKGARTDGFVRSAHPTLAELGLVANRLIEIKYIPFDDRAGVQDDRIVFKFSPDRLQLNKCIRENVLIIFVVQDGTYFSKRDKRLYKYDLWFVDGKDLLGLTEWYKPWVRR